MNELTPTNLEMRPPLFPQIPFTQERLDDDTSGGLGARIVEEAVAVELDDEESDATKG